MHPIGDMHANGAAHPAAVFRSISALEKTGRQPWVLISIAAVSYCVALWRVEIPVLIGCAFALWMLMEAWRATGSIPATAEAPFGSYGGLQPASKWNFAPSLAAFAVVFLLAFIPWRIPAAVVLAAILAIWVTANAVSTFSRASASAGPPFNTFSALTKAESRPGGFLLSAGAHAALCFIPVLAALVAAWLTPAQTDPPKEPDQQVVILKIRAPEPVKEKKVITPPNTRPSLRPPEEPERIDLGKLDLSRMAVEFAADHDQALPSVLADYGARVAFVARQYADDYFHDRAQVLPSEYVYSAADWSRLDRPGRPMDISTDYLLLLQYPERCAAIARLKSELGAAASDLQVFLVFPRVVRGFEQQLDSAIRNQAQKQAARLQGSIISRVLVAFSAQAPGIAVLDVKAAPAPAPN